MASNVLGNSGLTTKIIPQYNYTKNQKVSLAGTKPKLGNSEGNQIPERSQNKNGQPEDT